MRLFFFFLSLIMFSMVSPAWAQIESYTLNKPHTQIIFFIDHMGFSRSMGKFTDYNGKFVFDRTQPQNSSVEVSIDTHSLEMNDQKWNEHMKGADFFNVEKFPSMAFKSTAIKVKNENTADITGDLTLLGVTKPVTLAAKYNKSGKAAFGEIYMSGFSATADLKRSDFGMSFGLPLVGDDVHIVIEVEGERIEQRGEGAANK